MTAKYQRQRKFRAIPHKLTMHFVLEAVFVGFRKQWGTLQVDDITLWQAPVSWSFSPDKYFNGILRVILKRGQGKEVKFGDTHPCFARVGQGGHCSKLFNGLALTFACKISVPMIYHQIWFFFFTFPNPLQSFGDFFNIFGDIYVKQINSINQYMIYIIYVGLIEIPSHYGWFAQAMLRQVHMHEDLLVESIDDGLHCL